MRNVDALSHLRRSDGLSYVLTQIGSSSALALKVVGEVPAAADWNATLAALERWPTPGRITLERRWTMRRRGQLDDHLLASSDAGLVGGDAAAELDSLIAPLRAAVPLRQQRVTGKPGIPRDIAVLPGIGGASLAMGDVAATLFAAITDAVGSLPAPAGLGLLVWTDARAGDYDDETLAVHRLAEGVEVHVRARPSALCAAIRVWAGAPLPPGVLACIAALVGTNGDAWVRLHRPDAIVEETARLCAVRPPSAGSVEEIATVRSRLAALLALELPTAARRSRWIGRPWSGPTPTTGPTIGRVPAPSGGSKRFRLPWEQRQRHLFVCGRTGSGKSALLSRLIADDLEAGRGLFLLDPHGDLAQQALALVPRRRRDDVVFIEPHSETTAAIDVLPTDLSVEQRLARMSDAMDAFTSGAVAGWMRWRRPAKLILDCLDALPGIDATLTGHDTISFDEELRAGLNEALAKHGSRLRFPESRQYWDWTTHRLNGLRHSPGRFTFDHAPRYELAEHVRRGGIVIAHLSQSELGVGDTAGIGSVLLDRLANAVLAQGGVRADERPQLGIYIDEAHLFTRGNMLGAMLTQARKFGASLTLATQTPSRLGDLREEVMVNCATVAAFRLSKSEADRLADRAGPLGVSAISQLPRFHAVLMLEEHDAAERPLVLHPTSPPQPDERQAAIVRRNAEKRYGRRATEARRGDLTKYAARGREITEAAEARKDAIRAQRGW